MGRPKKIEVKKVEDVEDVILEPKKVHIHKLTIDFPNEGLNNIARKINEIIDHLDS